MIKCIRWFVKLMVQIEQQMLTIGKFKYLILIHPIGVKFNNKKR